MSLYSVVLFLHVCGDIGIFIGMGVQLLSLMAMREAKRVEQVAGLVGLLRASDGISVIGALFTIVSGLYMAFTVWGIQTGWIVVALGSIVVIMPVLIRGLIEPRMTALVKTAQESPEGPLPESLQVRIHDPILGTALQTGAAVVFGIVFLMTNKPSLLVSVIVILVALVLGLASGIPLLIRNRRGVTSLRES